MIETTNYFSWSIFFNYHVERFLFWQRCTIKRWFRIISNSFLRIFPSIFPSIISSFITHLLEWVQFIPFYKLDSYSEFLLQYYNIMLSTFPFLFFSLEGISWPSHYQWFVIDIFFRFSTIFLSDFNEQRTRNTRGKSASILPRMAANWLRILIHCFANWNLMVDL